MHNRGGSKRYIKIQSRGALVILTNVIRLIRKYRGFITYCIVGGVNTLLSFSIFTISLFFDTHVVIAQALAYASGLVSSFLLNKYVTFKNKPKSLRQIILFLIVTTSTMLISMAAIYFFHEIIGIQEHIANIFFVSPIVVVLNYSGFRYIVFADNSTKNKED